MTKPSTIVLVAVTKKGTEQARLLRQRLRQGEVYRPARYGASAHRWEILFEGPLAELVADLFSRCSQMVFFLAAGAVTRLIAPCLGSKETDPGVLAVDEAGSFVIPLLSGHKGGANALARTVAGCLGAVAVITTASDVIGGLSLDLLEEEFGWTAEPRDGLKTAARALVDGEHVAIIQEIGAKDCWLRDLSRPPNAMVFQAGGELAGKSTSYTLWITDRIVEVPIDGGVDHILWYRPKSLVLGVGCERGVSAEALQDALAQFLAKECYALSSIAAVASVDLKADEQGLIDWASAHGWPTIFFSAEELAAADGIANPSPVVARCVGTPGVAEPAALLAAGTKRLLVEKQVLSSPLAPQKMTFALARLASFAQHVDDAPGKVTFVSAGPGDPDLITLKGQQALANADVVVYAGSLVPEDVLRHAPATAVRHNSAHLTLERVMDVLTTAVRAGKRVVRLHSGDTSLYSAIQEQMALLDEAGIGYDVVPGVSAFQAAAAALRAELTLPEVVQTVILTRAEGQTPMPRSEALQDLARHQATLCIFLSARLAGQVQEQLLTAYPPQTPTAILYRVSWPDEKIVITDVAHLAEEITRHHLTRTTLIMVGKAIASRQNRSRLYNASHGHIFRARNEGKTHPTA